MKLNELASTIKAQIVRVCFDPTTERTNFLVIINGERFDFFCGLLGCIPKEKRVASGYGSKVINPLLRFETELKAASHYSNGWRYYQLIRQSRMKAIKNLNVPEVMAIFNRLSSMAEPTLGEVLYCLRLDSEAVHQSFDDWCAVGGYNSDSISAFRVYTDCVENGKKLRRALGNEMFEKVLTAEEE